MRDVIYSSGKRYDIGLSCCFRQHKATHSHCSYLHGYALRVELEFFADELDKRNWVVDFGGMGEIKKFLKETFDHKLLIAESDPQKDVFLRLGELGLAQPVVLEEVGCEAFAFYIFEMVTEWVKKECPGASLDRVRVEEHDNNFATVYKTTMVNEEKP